MFKKELMIQNKTGLHARPASDFAALCHNIRSDIRLIAGTAAINPKSIISILAGGLSQGSRFTLEIDGPDEEEAGEKIVRFFEELKD